MENSKRNEIVHAFVWLGLYAAMAAPQMIMFAIAALLAVGGTSGYGVTTIFVTAVSTIPVMVPLFYIIIMRKRTLWGNWLLGISVVLALIVTDAVASIYSQYTVTNIIRNQVRTTKTRKFESNHPSKTKTLIYQDTPYEWYLDENTGEIEEVRGNYYMTTKLESTKGVSDNPLMKGKLASGIELNIVSFDNRQTVFDIGDSKRTYTVDRNLLRGNFEDFTLAKPIELRKVGNELTYSEGDVLEGVRVTGIIFKRNGEQVLSRVLKETSMDITLTPTVDGPPIISANNKLVEPGEWEVYLTGYFPGIDSKIILSNRLKYQMF